jgi:hypothetical protein
MKTSLLFWGFQDLNFISLVAKKAKNNLNISQFYVQIVELEKSISLADIQPEEIIRTKYDLHNLFQWLNRNSNLNVLVFIDLFNLIYQGNTEENLLSLKKILDLKIKLTFLTPKMRYPQDIEFIENPFFNKIQESTNEYSKNLKMYYEMLVNSGLNNHIIETSIPETIILNRREFNLFEKKIKFKISFYPKIFSGKIASYVSYCELSSKIIEAFSSCLSHEKNVSEILFFTIDGNSSVNYSNKTDAFLKLFKPSISISLDRFYSLKYLSHDYNYILWLLFLSISENQVKNEKYYSTANISDLYFIHQR